MKRERRKILITGCARSGTLFASQVLRSIDIDINHERTVTQDNPIGRDGIASWFMASDDPSPPFGPSSCDYEFDLTIQQVRHPLKVIPSVAQFILQRAIFSPGFIERITPETRLSREEQELNYQDQLILKAARYWYYWNLLAESKADLTVKVERLESELPKLCDSIGFDITTMITREVSRETNARSWYIKEAPWLVNWQDLQTLDSNIYYKIRELAAKYGYD